MIFVVAGIILLAVIGTTMVLGSLVARTWSTSRRRRRLEIADRLRLSAMELVDTDDAPVAELTAPEADVFAELLVHYSQQLKGEAGGRIGAYFEATGAVERERRRLHSRRERPRVDAAFRLGDMASTQPVPDLLLALHDRSLDVRAAAVRSLGRLGASEAAEDLIGASVDQQVPRAVVGAALVEIGPTAVPHLRALLDHPDPKFRAHVIELIGLVGSASDGDPLPALLRDMSSEVRAAAASALGRLAAGSGRDALIEALHDRVPFVRAAAAGALGQIGGQHAKQALLDVARHDEFDVARQAAQALARIDPVLVLEQAERVDAGPHLLEAADRLDL